MTLKEFIANLQSLPEEKKKIVFYITMSVVVLIVGFVGVIMTMNNISKMGDSINSVEIPSFDLNLQSGSLENSPLYTDENPNITENPNAETPRRTETENVKRQPNNDSSQGGSGEFLTPRPTPTPTP